MKYNNQKNLSRYTTKPKTKLWASNRSVDTMVEQFTIGQDQNLDLYLAEFDVIGSIAHIIMLNDIGLLPGDELIQLKTQLQLIYTEIKSGNFKIEPGVEDIHSQIEFILTERLNEVGKKIHTGRSRNDQVLLDICLFTRNQIQQLVGHIAAIIQKLLLMSEKHKNIGMPGYTHSQPAMPSSFGLWFAAFAESLVDDLLLLQTAYKIVNKNPLGSAAGYGSTFPLNRELTTKLLGFDELAYNSIYAQMGRGKYERIVSQALSSVAETLGKLANDIILYMSENYNFISLPDDLTTGSSIMPHKKNPDVLEILRGRFNLIKSLPGEILIVTNNLMTGYHRDFQLVKERFIPSLVMMSQCLFIFDGIIEKIQVRDDILTDKFYTDIYSVERVHHLVQNGLSFRDAYRKVADEISNGEFIKPEALTHIHEGSIGNLCNSKIELRMKKIMSGFDFKKVDQAIQQLLSE